MKLCWARRTYTVLPYDNQGLFGVSYLDDLFICNDMKLLHTNCTWLASLLISYIYCAKYANKRNCLSLETKQWSKLPSVTSVVCFYCYLIFPTDDSGKLRYAVIRNSYCLKCHTKLVLPVTYYVLHAGSALLSDKRRQFWKLYQKKAIATNLEYS